MFRHISFSYCLAEKSVVYHKVFLIGNPTSSIEELLEESCTIISKFWHSGQDSVFNYNTVSVQICVALQGVAVEG